jgi:hypothetical protein
MFYQELKNAIQDNENIAFWYYSVTQLCSELKIFNLHHKQEEFLEKCVEEMLCYLEIGDYPGICKVASKYYKKASCDQLKDYVVNAWDRYVTVLNLMGVDTPEIDLLEV